MPISRVCVPPRLQTPDPERDIDATVADDAGELARTYRGSHPGIDIADYLIAAAARSIDARLVTLKVRHYPMFEGLEPAYR